MAIDINPVYTHVDCPDISTARDAPLLTSIICSLRESMADMRLLGIAPFVAPNFKSREILFVQRVALTQQ